MIRSKHLRKMEKLAMEKTNQDTQQEEVQSTSTEQINAVQEVVETSQPEVPVKEEVSAVEDTSTHSETEGKPETLPTEEVKEPEVVVVETAQAPVVEEKQEVPEEKTEVVEKVQELIKPTQAEPATSTEAARELSEEEQYLEKIRTDGTVEQKRMLAAVETFVQNLRPKTVIDPDKGVRFQYEFLQHLLWVLEKDYDAFRAGWNVLLVYFSLHHGRSTPSDYTALSEYSTTRFLFAWNKGEERCNAYRNLITLLRATRNKETRKHDIKTIMIDKIAPDVISQKAVDNLKKFYAV